MSISSASATASYARLIPAHKDAIKKPYEDMIVANTSRKVANEDSVTISDGASKIQQYFDQLGTITSGVKHEFLRDNFAHNSKLVNEQVDKIMQAAEQDGIKLNRGMIISEVRQINGVFPPSGHDMDVLSPTGPLSDKEKEFFRRMHEYAEENGLPARYVVTMALDFGLKKMEAEKGQGETPVLDKAYVESEIEKLKSSPYGDPSTKAENIATLQAIVDDIAFDEKNNAALMSAKSLRERLHSLFSQDKISQYDYDAMTDEVEKVKSDVKSMLTAPDSEGRYNWIEEFTKRFQSAREKQDAAGAEHQQHLLGIMKAIVTA